MEALVKEIVGMANKADEGHEEVKTLLSGHGLEYQKIRSVKEIDLVGHNLPADLSMLWNFEDYKEKLTVLKKF